MGFLRGKRIGNSLVVQGLELSAFTAEGQVQSLVRELRSHKPQGKAKNKIFFLILYIFLIKTKLFKKKKEKNLSPFSESNSETEDRSHVGSYLKFRG